MMRDLILRTRSIRRYRQEIPIEYETLRELVDLARYSPSGGNVQPLKYIITCDPIKNSLIFPHLNWAMQLKNWKGPIEGERPAAYIVILQDTTISTYIGCDHGIAAMSIVLGANERGLGACIHGATKKEGISLALNIPDHLDVLLVISLGIPNEKVVIEDVISNGDTNYWRDSNETHHVPKRSLDKIIVDY